MSEKRSRSRKAKKTNARKRRPARRRRGPPSSDAWKERLTRGLMRQAVGLARQLEAAAIFVYAEALPEQHAHILTDHRELVTLVARSDARFAELEEAGFQVIRAPGVHLPRMGQVKLAILLALAQGRLRSGDVILCLVGIADTETLDTLVTMEVGREFEVFVAPSGSEATSPRVRPEVLVRVLDIAVDLGTEGREGRPVGALFVIGDSDRVLEMSRQLIINPFRGYPESDRSVLDPGNTETMKEFSALDGAFIVRDDGVLEAAGAFLKIQALPDQELASGLGARHHAAAGITAVTDSIAVVVSESTGTVSLFRNGQLVIQIERGQRAAVPDL